MPRSSLITDDTPGGFALTCIVPVQGQGDGDPQVQVEGLGSPEPATRPPLQGQAVAGPEGFIDGPMKAARRATSPAVISEIIEMALSDHVSFAQLRALHGLSPDEVQALMKRELKRGSYLAWRKRVRQFSDRRAFYK